MKVHVTFPLFESALAALREQGWVIDMAHAQPPESEETLLRSTVGCEGILCSLFDRLDRNFFEALDREYASRAESETQLRCIAQFGVGHNNIDIQAATDRGIVVTNTPGVLTDATAEIAVMLMLAAARRLGEGERIVRAGKWTGWEPSQMLGVGITGKTLGIVGAGRIGAATARKMRGFEMRVLYASRQANHSLEQELGARQVSLDELLAEADFVSIHVPLTSETRHLVGERQLRAMKPTAVLVNTSRGAVVDEAALVQALKEGWIGAAGLDVYEHEPALTPGLAELENVVLAPHLGSATRETREQMGLLAARNLIAVLNGDRPPTPVNAP